MVPRYFHINIFLFLVASLDFAACTLPADVIINPAYCSSNNDCPNFFYPVCDPSTHQCVHSCSNTDCDRISGTGLGVCTNARCYVTCSAVDDPICNAMRAYCGTTSGTVRCYQCGSDAQCQNAGYGANSVCDTTSISGFGVCSSCPSTGCTIGTCQNYKCVECTDDNYCLTNKPTKPHCEKKFEGNLCQECYQNSHCISPSKSLCSSNTCGICGSDPDCSHLTATPYCIGSGCVQCTQDSHCPSTGTPYCVGNTCQDCSTGICSSRFSSSNPTKLACEISSGVCVECNSDGDCPSTGTPYCVGNSCQACSTGICSARFSTTTPTKLACEASSGVCVGCLGNSDCPLVTESFCNTQTCQACTQDAHCTHITGKNKCYQGECYTYQAQCPPMYSNIVVTQNQNVFTVKVPASLASQVDIMTSLQVVLQSVATSDYTYSLTKSTSTVFILTFTFDKTVPATVLKLTIPCPTQSGYLYGDIVINFNTEKVLYSTPEIQQTVETIQSLTSTAATAMTSVSGSMMFAGANPAILWALINLLQMFYYLVFINVEYPVNVQPFFQLFTMGNLSFIPNPIGWIFPDIDDESLDAPKKFLENDVNGLFFQTAGNMLLAWIVVSVGYLASFLFLRYTRNMPKLLTSISSKTVSIFEWSGVFRTLITSYTQLTMSALLQMRVLNYKTKLFSFSSIFGIIFVMLAGVIPFITWQVIYKFHKRPKIMKFKFSTLIEELKIDSKYALPKYFNVLFLLRRLVMVIALVFLHDFPYIEISVLLVSCVAWTIFLCLYLPYESKLNNVINIFSELIFAGVHVLIFLLIHDDFTDWLTDQQRLKFGWGIMGGCGTILVASLISSFAQQFVALKKFIKLIIQVIKGKDPKKRKLRRAPQKRKTFPEVSRSSIERTRTSIDRKGTSLDKTGVSFEGSLGESQKSFISSVREINLEISNFEGDLKRRRKS